MKKGYINSLYTSVYKSNKNIIVTSSSNSSTIFFHILNKDFDISAYLNKIVEKSERNQLVIITKPQLIPQQLKLQHEHNSSSS